MPFALSILQRHCGKVIQKPREDCMVALKIINEYKKRGEVGSTFVASSVPVL